MKSELAADIDLVNNFQIMNYCKDCKFWEGTCTKKIAIRICKKDNIKVKKQKTNSM